MSSSEVFDILESNGIDPSLQGYADLWYCTASKQCVDAIARGDFGTFASMGIASGVAMLRGADLHRQRSTCWSGIHEPERPVGPVVRVRNSWCRQGELDVA